MADNFLQLYEEKTEVLVCAPETFVSRVMENLSPLATFAKPSVRNLGVTFDSALTLDAHVESLFNSCFYHLRNISKLSHSVSRLELEIVIDAFV